MALDRDHQRVIDVPNVARRVVLRTHGAMRYMDPVQGAWDDIEGAVGEKQYLVAAYQARCIVLMCLSLQSLARGGDMEFQEYSVSFDYFTSLDPFEIADGLELANAGLDIDDGTAGAWLERLRAYVEATERLLGYEERLPVLRSPNGAFGLIAITRQWDPILSELGLPSMLPADWLS